MAGRTKTKPVAGRPLPNQGTRRRRAARSRAYGELVEIASRRGVSVRPNQSSAKLLQECLDRVSAQMRHASDECDKVPEGEFWVVRYDAQMNRLVEPNKWFQLEAELRAEAVQLAGLMEQLGLAERMVSLQETQANAILRAVLGAAREIGLSPDQTKRLGPALRGQLRLIQGGASDDPVIEGSAA